MKKYLTMERNFLSDKEILERIVAIETELRVRTRTDEQALDLARGIVAKDLELARAQVDHRLESHNEWQKRWDKREAVLATKADVSLAVKSIIGVVVSLIAIIGIILKWFKFV